MNKQNKAPQATISPRMVDVSKLFTPTGYAKHIGKSRQQVYNMIETGTIKEENVVEIKSGTLIIGE